MSSLDELLSQIPVDQIARRLGVDEQTAATAVRAALPTLVGGLEANTRDPDGATSLLSALDQHRDSPLLEDGVNVTDVDTADGDRIVSNVFGDNKDRVVQTLGRADGAGGSDLVARLLPILAPIVLTYLARQAGKSGEPGGLSDLLGGLLRSASGGTGSGGASGGLGGVLGSVLGGNGGGLGDLLGGLLGGGKR
ncbi:hypothetical protein G352_12027 [Rhodococcus ruber BKS 20-38]|uniref:DUF937 domain-containing protein n=1 Tax=Rhodococcus ruber BKS 20-38 TaxID=1278076 RepID=M2XVH0_9NOCA|nr:DUF937 domain-containing protein [Rhodococcus ruber]EME64961.1 hypothetical protein G352_12027 [Rhodococcus ruber BKS 20-38]